MIPPNILNRYINISFKQVEETFESYDKKTWKYKSYAAKLCDREDYG